MFKKVLLFLLCLLNVVLLISCSSKKVENKESSTKSTQSTTSKIQVLTDENKAVLMPVADKSKAIELMKKVSIASAVSSKKEKISISDVQKYIPVSQLRSVKLEGSYSYIKFYSVNKLDDKLKLFTFYGLDDNGDYTAFHNMIVNSALQVEDFNAIKNKKSTIDDVEKIDSATKLNFYNKDDEYENSKFYVKFIDNCQKNYYSAHVTKNGVVNITYRKENNEFVVDNLYTDKDFEFINCINSDDLK